MKKYILKTVKKGNGCLLNYEKFIEKPNISLVDYSNDLHSFKFYEVDLNDSKDGQYKVKSISNNIIVGNFYTLEEIKKWDISFINELIETYDENNMSGIVINGDFIYILNNNENFISPKELIILNIMHYFEESILVNDLIKDNYSEKKYDQMIDFYSKKIDEKVKVLIKK